MEKFATGYSDHALGARQARGSGRAIASFPSADNCDLLRVGPSGRRGMADPAMLRSRLPAEEVERQDDSWRGDRSFQVSRHNRSKCVISHTPLSGPVRRQASTLRAQVLARARSEALCRLLQANAVLLRRAGNSEVFSDE